MNPTLRSQETKNNQELTQIEDVIERILTSGQITRCDQNSLAQALLSGYLPTRAEHEKIREIYSRLQKGLLKVVD